MSQPSHPLLVFIRGLPGSGKSYITVKLDGALQALYGKESTVVLDPDATNYASKAYQQHVKDQTAEGL
jgi:pantothenate kinase-related protein Tda10